MFNAEFTNAASATGHWWCEQQSSYVLLFDAEVDHGGAIAA